MSKMIYLYQKNPPDFFLAFRLPVISYSDIFLRKVKNKTLTDYEEAIFLKELLDQRSREMLLTGDERTIKLEEIKNALILCEGAHPLLLTLKKKCLLIFSPDDSFDLQFVRRLYLTMQVIFITEEHRELACRKLNPAFMNYAVYRSVREAVEAIDSGIDHTDIPLTQKETAGKVPTFSVKRKQQKKVYQILPSYQYGDAIGNYAALIQKCLEEYQIESSILAGHTDGIHPSLPVKENLSGDAIYIYHYSTHYERSLELSLLKNIAIIYHNITPPNFFSQRPDLKIKMELAYKELMFFINKKTFAVSESNIHHLLQKGFNDTELLPYMLSLEKWKLLPDRNTEKKLTQRKVNLLYTGRLAPNKDILFMIEIFYYLKKMIPSSRLILAGSYEAGDPYYSSILYKIAQMELFNDVWITGKMMDESFLSLYMHSDFFITASLHEGFCVPLIEAGLFRIPFLVRYNPAYDYTLKDAPFFFSGNTAMECAGEIVAILQNESLCHDMSVYGHANAGRFIYENHKQELNPLVHWIHSL